MKKVSKRLLVKHKIKSAIKRISGAGVNPIQRRLITLNSYEEILKIFNWNHHPILNDEIINEFSYVEDVNNRRRRDAESVLSVCRNIEHGTILEIGTAGGGMTASLSENSPSSAIYTVNIPPEEACSGDGGKLITKAFRYEEIGKYYKDKSCTNVRQIYANTATWEPSLPSIDLAFIDGCHDTEFVINDTLKVLGCMKPGGIICWHDCHPDLRHVHKWLDEVYTGIELLVASGHLPGHIYWVRDSWVFIYQTPVTSMK